MKITINKRELPSNVDREHTVLNIDNVSRLHLQEDNPRIDFELYFAEDGKKVFIKNKRDGVEMNVKPLANTWEVELSEVV